MAQENQANQTHGSINPPNHELPRPSVVSHLNNSYSNSDDAHSLHKVVYSPTQIQSTIRSSGSLNSQLYRPDSRIPCATSSLFLDASTSQVSVPSTSDGRVNTVRSSYNITPSMTHVQTTSAQPDMLETLLTRTGYTPQVQVVQGYSKTISSTLSQPSSASNSNVRQPSQPSSLSSGVSTSNGQSGVSTDPEKRQLIQRQLLLLLHAHRCQRQESEENGHTCPTQHCRTMRGVLRHMSSCTEGKNCRSPHCASSRQIISHWKNCSSRECPVCEPLKQNQQSQRLHAAVRSTQANVIPPGRIPEINGVDSSPQSVGSHVPVNVPRTCSTSTNPPSSTSFRASVQPYSTDIESSVNGVTSTNAASCTSVDQTSWRRSVDMQQRNHVIRRIVKFIFPYPDPAAYSDPRMKNLIEYARKVEREMYVTATNMDHYFNLLAQKCYKIHRELEEKRKSRQLHQDTSQQECVTPTASVNQTVATSVSQGLQALPPSSTALNVITSCSNGNKAPVTSTTNNFGNSSDVFDMGSFNSHENNTSEHDMSKFEQYLQSACNQRYKSDVVTTASEPPSTSSSGPLLVPSVKPCSEENNAIVTTTLSVTPMGDAVSGKVESLKVECKADDNDNPIDGNSAIDSFSSGPSSVIPPVSATFSSTALVKPDESKWKRWSREELLRHFLQLHEELYNDKHAEPFRAPVDPVMLHIPDYFQVIKEPMDLTTIRNNLEDGKYTDPWQVVDHFRLMFNNAWLYNKKTSKVYKICSKLAELFQSRIDQVMQAMGFCCGQDYEYQPQGLYCASANLCTISRDAIYYVYFNNDKQATGLVCDKYYQCEKCFNEANDVVVLADEANPPVSILKDLFEKHKNNVKEKEEFVLCNECGRRWHKICALHMNEIWPTGFVCPGCLRERGLKRKENRYTAKKLPVTPLSSFLEKRVNDFLKKKEVGTGEVTIRVLASSDKTVEVKPLMRARFTESGELSESFPYRLKAIFAFQEIDGQDVCFFGLYVQEYGSDSPQPNRRRVYVAYLDSVFFFRPKQYRTDVYHEILVGYLHYAKRCGYTMAHIWACPPGEGDDYIFHMHPPEQKIPKAKRLQEWYRKMLQKAIIEGIVVDYKNILKDALDHKLVSPTEIPYFEGDFWPNTLEDILKELEEEEARRRREEAMAQAEADEDDNDCSGLLGDGLPGDQDKRTGKKKAKKRKGNKKGNSSTASKRKRLDGPIDGVEELSRKVYDTMDKLKEIFFVIRLHRHNSAASLPPIKDPDQPIHSELMDSRDAFLQMARERHLEFSSLRRAKYSTIVLLYELHVELRQNFMYNCNVCKAQVETRWHCNECDEFDLCSRCYKTENHPHPMVKCGLGIDEDSGSNEEGGDRPAGAGSDRRNSIERCIKSLLHACQCRDANCRMQTCTQMKRVLCHTKNCSKKTTNSCLLCRQLLSLLWHHARCCEESKCPVPFCLNIKYRVKQKHLQQRLQQNKLLRRRISTMNRGALPSHENPVASHSNSLNSDNTALPSNSSRQIQSYQISDSNTVNTTNAVTCAQQFSQSQIPTVVPYPTVDGQPTRRPVCGVYPTQVNVASVVRPSAVGTTLTQMSRIVVHPSSSVHNAASTVNASPLTTVTSYRGVRPITSSLPVDVSASYATVSNCLPQQQSAVSSLGHQTPGTSNGGAVRGQTLSQPSNQKAYTIAAMAAKAKPQDIALVSQVINNIKATGESSEEQNRKFIEWIKRHPEYHAAFFALHSQNRQQAGLRAQSTQRRLSSTTPSTSITPQPSSCGPGTLVVTPAASDSGHTFVAVNSTSNNMVIVSNTVTASVTNSGGSHLTNVAIGQSPLVAAVPVVSATASITPATVTSQSPVVQPVQWISIQQPATTNHHQPLMSSLQSSGATATGSTTTLRFRALPGTSPLVQSQPQPVQHFYSATSMGPPNGSVATNNSQNYISGGPSSGIFVSTSSAGMLPVNPGTSVQQVLSGAPSRMTSSSKTGLTLTRQNSIPPPATVVQFRSQQQPINSIQQHIILTNPNASAQLHHHAQSHHPVSSSTSGRQVVALMTHPTFSAGHPGTQNNTPASISSTTTTPLDPSGNGSSLK